MLRNFLFFILFLHASFAKSQVFTGTGGFIPYGQYAYYDIDVSGVGTIDCNFEVCIDISHNRINDVVVALVAPNNDYIYLTYYNGGNGDDYSNTCFSMDATTNITNGSAPFTGTYVPQGDLSDFDGINANGEWQLAVLDNYFFVSGTLNSWSLDFTNCITECEDNLYNFSLSTDGWGEETSFSLNDNDGLEIFSVSQNSLADYTDYFYDFCLENACYELTVNDSYGDGIFSSGGYQMTDELSNVIFEMTDFDYSITHEFCIGSFGCTDPAACNFDLDAEEDDGSCFYTPLTVDDCEVVYCDSESGEQVASQYSETNINYLTIDITENGVINELFYDINWHSHGWGNINFNVNNATIALYDNFGAFVQNIAVIGNNLSISTYQNFTNTLITDIDVYAGYSIQVFINSPNWGGGTWASYVNEADISFTVITESVNAGNDVTLDLCYDDSVVNLYSLLGQDVDVNGNWSPQLTGGYLGTFNPVSNTAGIYTYTIQGDCSTDEAFVDVNLINLATPQINASVDSVCYGTSSVTYSVNPNFGSTYSWSVNGGIIVGQINGNSLEVDWSTSAVGSISDAVVLTESSNGCSISSSIDVTIIANPTPQLSIDFNEICLGESVIVSANSSYNSYNWVPTTISSYSDTYTPNSISDNQISVTVSGDAGCTTSESIDFTIYELPDVNLISNVTSLCNGDSIVLSANASYSDYSWSSSAISGSSDIYYPSPNEDMISLTVTGDGGCSSSDSIDIIVFDLPIVDLSIDNSEICIGESISLSTTSGYNNYEWTPSSINSNAAIYTPTSLNDNQFSVTITGNGNCVASDTIDITIYDLPVVNLSIDDADLCLGESLVVSSNPAYDSYAWTPSTISGSTDVYFPSSSLEDMISLTVTGDGGCMSSDSLAITVYDLPIVNLSVNNSEICIGESINLNTTAGYTNYDWSPSSITSNTDSYTPTSLTDNQISVTITGDGDCASTDSLEFTIFDLPVVEVSLSDSVICLDESIVVSATSGFENYDWTPSLLNSTNVITPLITETNYSVEVTDINGCISSADANLVINQSTPISLSVNGSSTTTICIGEEIDFLATPGFDSYTWSIPNISSNQTTYVPSDLLDNQFSVIGTNQFGCNSTSALNITINNIPTPSLISVFSDSVQTMSQSLNLCVGVSNIKFSSVVSSIANPVEWVFIDGNGALIESGQNTSELEVSFPIVEDYILEFREYGSQNCFTPQQIEIKVNANPVLDVSYVEDCYKDSVYFTNSSSVDTTIQSVSWSVDGYSFDSYNLSYPLDNDSKVFELTIVDVLNCSSTLSTAFVPSERPYVNFYHEPEKVTILDPEVSFVNLSTEEDIISWNFGDNQISNEWSPIHTYDSLGWFEVVLKVQNEAGCADSIAKKLLVENESIYYFPSSFTPDGDGLNDEFGISGFRVNKIKEYQFQITNRWGEVVFYSEDVNQTWDGKTSKGNDAITGSYLWSVRIIDELGKVTRKFGDFILLR